MHTLYAQPSALPLVNFTILVFEFVSLRIAAAQDNLGRVIINRTSRAISLHVFSVDCGRENMQAAAYLPLSSRTIKNYCPKPWQINETSYLPRGKYRNWDELGMKNAVEAVKGGMAVRHASDLYDVPKSTLSDKALGKVPMRARSGPPSYLTIEEEEELTSFLLEMAKIGYALTRKQVIALVQRITDSKNISANISSGWWERYVRRHPQLTLRVAVPVSMARAMASDRDVIDRYFDMLEDCLKSNGIFNKPSCIFNCDESGIPLNPKSLKVVDKVGSKNPSYLTSGSKTQITVLACTCGCRICSPSTHNF